MRVKAGGVVLYKGLRINELPDIVIQSAGTGHSGVSANCNHRPFCKVGNLKRVLEGSGSLGSELFQQFVLGV